MVVCNGYCGKDYNKSDMIEEGKKLYCESCYARKKNEDLELQALRNYIQYIFKYRPNKMINTQIEKYRNTNGWSYKNIRLTLEYMYLIREINMEYKYGIGLVPHYYDEMISYHKKRLAQAKEIEDSKKKSKHITVNKKKDDMHKFNKGRMVDLEGIDDEDE